jgi:hypothetical protein
LILGVHQGLPLTSKLTYRISFILEENKMPRRSSARNHSIQLSPPPQHTTSSPPPTLSEPLTLLRKQWKWAAFSQFYFTFNQIIQTNDISLNVCHHKIYKLSPALLFFTNRTLKMTSSVALPSSYLESCNDYSILSHTTAKFRKSSYPPIPPLPSMQLVNNLAQPRQLADCTP